MATQGYIELTGDIQLIANWSNVESYEYTYEDGCEIITIRNRIAPPDSVVRDALAQKKKEEYVREHLATDEEDYVE